VIGLVLGTLRSRPAQALTVALLAAFVTASAVAVPAFLAAGDRLVIEDEWPSATAERTIRASAVLDLGDRRDRGFESTVPAQLDRAGITAVFAAETDVNLSRRGVVINPRLVFREDSCAHLVILAGRCPVAGGEVMVGAATARRLGLAAGDPVSLRQAIPIPPPPAQFEGLGPNPAEPPMTAAVVGVFRVRDPGEQYWADQGYFWSDPPRDVAEPIFTDRGTLEALGHSRERQSVDGLLDRAALRADRLAALRAAVAAAKRNSEAAGANTATSIPAMLDRIDRDRAMLRQVVPLAAVPLLFLGWFLLYFAVAYTAGERRAEIGLVRLRGTGWLRRWVLALGGSAVAVLAGTAGTAVVTAALGPTPWRYLLAALAGGLLAVVLAGRPAFAGPAADLLRQVPPRSARWRAATAEGVVLALAAAAVVQMRGSAGRLTGVMLFAPGLVMLAVALLAARLVVPVAGALGARAVRRGRLATGLGALELARRPAAARLTTVLVVALAELLFAATAADVAAQARTARVSIALGAPRVLHVAPVPAGRLLDAVHRADPQGRYAMAVSSIPRSSPVDPPVLAVDSARLAQVATWQPDFAGVSVAQIADRLHPAAPPPVTLRGLEVGLDMSAGRLDPAAQLHIFIGVVTPDGSLGQLVDLGRVRSGRHRYAAEVTGCDAGCRVTGLQLASPGYGTEVSLVLHGLTAGAAQSPVDAGFDRAGRWRTTAARGDDPAPRLAPGAGGLAVEIPDPSMIANGRLVPVDTPYPLPVVSISALPRASLGLTSSDQIPAVRVGTAHVLPGLGGEGVLVDLEYLDRIAAGTQDAPGAAVWLAAGAPADITHRLEAAGLTVTGAESITGQVRYLSGQGPGVGLRFHLIAGLLGLLLAVCGLALVVTVDRRRGPHLWVLRSQGVAARTINRAGLLGYGALVAAAAVLAPLAAGAAWWGTGGRIPIFADGRSPVPPPSWPSALPVLRPWLAAAALLAVVVVALGYRWRGARRDRW
jgi:hypothetical protein